MDGVYEGFAQDPTAIYRRFDWDAAGLDKSSTTFRPLEGHDVKAVRASCVLELRLPIFGNVFCGLLYRSVKAWGHEPRIHLALFVEDPQCLQGPLADVPLIAPPMITGNDLWTRAHAKRRPEANGVELDKLFILDSMSNRWKNTHWEETSNPPADAITTTGDVFFAAGIAQTLPPGLLPQYRRRPVT